MKCPRCGRDELTPPEPCPECSFSGPPAQIEELGHVQYLLKELAGWSEIPQNIKERLQARYFRRRRQLEIALELRQPPLSHDATRAALQERVRLRQLLVLISYWTGHDWIKPDAADALSARTKERSEELLTRLSEPDTPSVSAFRNRDERVALLKSLQDEMDKLHQEDAWTDEDAYQAATDNLQQRVERLEIELGLRRRPKIKKPPPAKPTPAAEPPPKPREPITWERIRRTLLSERTLRALLFVSVFLLFASAVTLVVYNWTRFRPLVQVAILTGFTLFFYVVGWYVRTKLELPQSSIALFATGSLLIPVDFYAIYLSGGIFSPEAWAEVWWMTSAVCLVAYVIAAATLRVEFFGYLVGAATGSLLCATFQVIDVPGEWWTPSLSALALLLMLPSRRWEHSPEESLPRVFGRPFRHLALLTVTSTLLLTTGLHIAGQLPHPAPRLPLALDWWLACGVYIIAAARYPRRHLLTSTACITAPTALFLTLRLYLEIAEISPAWHALGWALLTPIYLIVGWRLSRLPKSSETLEVSQGQSRTVVGWTIALIVLAVAWAFGDMSAAASAHGVLTGSVALAVVLWQRPNLLLFTSLLSFSTVTTWMSTLGLDLAQYSLGWALLSILHVIAAVLLRRVQTRPPQPAYASMLYAAACAAAALSLLPPLVALDTHLMAYALGNWIALAGWMAWLAHKKDGHPGLHRFLRLAGPPHRNVLHWAAALPFPIWFWLTWTNARATDAWLGVGFAILAWVCVGLGRWLARHDKAYGLPWYAASLICSVLGPTIAGSYYEQPLLAGTLLSGAALYFCYAYLFRHRWWLLVGGLVLPFGYTLALDHLGLPPDPLAASLALVPAAYVLIAIWLEQRRGVAAGFLEPLYGMAHVVAAAAFLWGFGGLWNQVAWDIPWTDVARLWATGGQLVLGVTYGLAAWFLEEEPWGHVAAWLGVIAGGLVATAYSQGRGSSAAKAALLAIVYVGAERALHALRERHSLPRKAWPLYRRPLLVAGWTVSGGTIALALIRNLWLLGGGPVRENWAIIGLLLIVALYAASAYLFRRQIFLWLAAPLLFAPWTLLTHQGWYVWQTPSAPRYALAWVVLAWVLVLVGLLLDSRAGKRYGFPLRTTAHVLVPFALLWGGADPSTSSATCGLGLAFYVLATFTDHRRGRTGLAAARFLYPAALLIPVWAVYLLAWRGPWLPHAHFGLLLLALALPVFVIARRLRHVHPADALPFYLACYGCAIVGTMLVSYDRSLLVLALLFDAGLALLSARLLREPLWIYPAAALPPAALVLALAEADWNPHRRGWWLIGLGAIYLTQSWALRRPSQSPNQKSPNLQSCATPLMVAAYAIIALGLPISSYEQTAAFWGYGAAALIYVISAVWLQEPLLLTPAAGLSAVPYAVALDWIPWITPADYGLAMWPGIIIALMIAHLLDYYLGAPRGFSWGRPERWFPEAARRLTKWWGLPLYVSGYVGALASAALSSGHPVQLMLTLGLAATIYGLATVRFRLRGWLLIAVATAQITALSIIDAAARSVFPLSPTWIARLALPGWQAFAFLPVTLTTAAVGLWIEQRHSEGSPLVSLHAPWEGWSRPLYWLLVLNLAIGQIWGITQPHPGTFVSLVHALLFAILAVVWAQPVLPYFTTTLGLLAVIQRLFWIRAPNTDAPVAFALLALGYGLLGYGLEYARTRARAKRSEITILEHPLEQSGLVVSAIAVLMMLSRGANVRRWLARALLGRPLMTADDVPVVQMAVAVLAIVGLLYLAMALVRRWYWRGYGAVALLLCAWSLEWFLVWDLREVQWYAIPAGLYLLGVGYLEWCQDRKQWARWIDRAALLLLLGSVFYQSLAEEYHWPYAMLMIGESLLIIWWGSARRQRRFLYTGVVGVVVAVMGQLIKQIFTINAFMAIGIPGLVLMILYILVERNLEAAKQLSQEWQERLEEWE